MNQFYSLWFWEIASTLYVPVFIVAFPQIEKRIKSVKKKPYKFAFKFYPMDPSLAFYSYLSAFLLAFVISYSVHNVDILRFYLLPTFGILFLIFLLVWVYPSVIILIISRNERNGPTDIMGDLYDFFLKEEIIQKLPYLRTSLNGGQLVYGRVSGISKDVLILSTDIGEEYINWESITSFTVMDGVKSG